MKYPGDKKPIRFGIKVTNIDEKGQVSICSSDQVLPMRNKEAQK
jgi:hypothetical protein